MEIISIDDENVMSNEKNQKIVGLVLCQAMMSLDLHRKDVVMQSCVNCCSVFKMKY